MWRQLSSIIVLLMLCLMITSCDSENVKTAKAAYDAENYPEVVNALENEQDLDEDTTRMLHMSKAHVAFNKGDYIGAIAELLSVENGQTEGLYQDAVKKLIATSIEMTSADDLIKAIELDPEIGDIAVKTIESRCDALEYNAFVLTDQLLNDLPEGEMKANLPEIL